MTTVNLDLKMHTAFSLISYANDLAKEVGMGNKERIKVINDMNNSSSFEELLEAFKHNFSNQINIIYKNKQI